ncbi:MAG TPA: folylpolyglutamate synthase/dihydrofolate synthase family protein [Gemmatimonadaceae bacterium]|nr:folylpolyglutamate synthase/dihydrofolate synthase family protein [Gemmatimonadaceae bacterium]
MDVPLTDYRAALDALFARTAGASKPGLERTEALLTAIGDPHRAFPAIHVAGTNGKGSVCATLDALLSAAGLKVGRYTSPHLVDFRERVLVGGIAIEPERVTEWLRRHDGTIEETGATFFEATTALAFDHFAREGVDVAVVETGLGGRLDSTNVLERPVVAVVTSIAADHTEILGSTLSEIAREKAGIFKQGAPAVIGEDEGPIASLLEACAHERGVSAVLRAGRDWRVADAAVDATGTTFAILTPGERRVLRTPLRGAHQAANAATALMTLRTDGFPWRLDAATIERGLAGVRLAGRFDRRERWLFDVAHNPEGMRVLVETIVLAELPRPLHVLLCVLADKDWRAMIDILAPAVDQLVVTLAPTAPEARRWDPGEAHAHAAAHGIDVRREDDFDRALALVEPRDGTTLVTGSFHTVGDAMARLRVDPLAR